MTPEANTLETILGLLTFTALGVYSAVEAYHHVLDARRGAPSLASVKCLPLRGRWLGYALAALCGTVALLCLTAVGMVLALIFLSGWRL